MCELGERHLDRTGEMDELRDRLESWLKSNGHDPEDYLFIDPFLRSMRDELRATFKSSQASMERIKTVAPIEGKLIEVLNGDRGENFAGLEKNRRSIEEVTVVLCPICLTGFG